MQRHRGPSRTLEDAHHTPPADAGDGYSRRTMNSPPSVASTPGGGSRWCSLAPRAIFGLGLLWLAFAGLGVRPLTEPDEGRYLLVALEMLRSGDWLTPRLHPAVEHLTKPPLTYWAIAAATKLLGPSALAARLPSAVALVITALVVRDLARTLRWGQPEVVALAFASSLGSFAAASVATADGLLLLWSSVAVLGSVRAVQTGRRWPWVATAWVALALGFLTKGPPVLLAPAAVAVALRLAHGRGRLTVLFPWWGPVVFAVIGLGWYATMAAIHPGTLEYLFRHELLGRLAFGVHQRNADWRGAFTVTLPSLVVATFPGFAWAGRRLGALHRVLRPSTWRRWRREDPEALLLALWLVGPVAVLCLVSSRMPLYVIPMVPAAVLLASRGRQVSTAAAALLVAWVIVLPGLRWATADVVPTRNAARLADRLREIVPGSPTDLLVVDHVNLFGVACSVDARLEHVGLDVSDLEEGISYRQRLLDDVLAELGPGTVVLVPPHREGDLCRALAAAGFQLDPRGRLHKLEVYTLTGRW